jgi:hypothetical protein
LDKYFKINSKEKYNGGIITSIMELNRHRMVATNWNYDRVVVIDRKLKQVVQKVVHPKFKRPVNIILLR